jgi:Anti-sigma-K factor rskA, C-terminal
VTIDHDGIQELLAGYVLRSLSGQDAAEADRLLTEHVPSCAECRATLDAFQMVTGELALDAPTVTPPDTVRARLRRELEPRSRARWNAGWLVAVAASVVVVVGIGGVVLTRGGGGGLVKGDGLARAELQDVTNAATDRSATQQPLGQATEISSPATEKLYIYGTNVPLPAPGSVYRLWSGSLDEARYVGDFLPNDDGMLLLEVTLPASTVGALFVTVEPAGSLPAQPGDVIWATAA